MKTWILCAALVNTALFAQTITDIDGFTQSPKQSWPVINTNFGNVKAAILAHNARTDNPHATTATQVGAIPDIGTTPGDVLFLNSGNVWTRLPAPSGDGDYCWRWTAGVPAYTACQSAIDSTSNLLIGNGSGAAVDSGLSASNVLTAAAVVATGTLLKGLGGHAVGTITLGGAGSTVPSITGTPAVGDCVQWAAGLAVTTTGAPCGAGGGGGSPTGAAGGGLTGTYPDPTLAAGSVTLAMLATAIKSGSGAKVQTTDGSGVSGQVPVYNSAGTLINSGVTPGGIPSGVGIPGKILGTNGTIPIFGGLTGYLFDGTNWVPDGTVFAELNATNNPFVKFQAPTQPAGPTALTAADTITCDRMGKAVFSASAITLTSVPNITGTIGGDICQVTNTGNFAITLQCNTVQADSQVVCPGGGTTIVLDKWSTTEFKRSTTLSAWTVVGVPTTSGGSSSGLLLPSPAATGIAVITDAATGATKAATITGGNGFTFTNGSGVSGNPTFVAPGTAKGDLLVRNVAGAYVALPVSATAGSELIVDSSTATGLAWSPAAANPLTTKGDLYTFGTANDRLAVGTDGQVLQADSTQTDGIKWTTNPYRKRKYCQDPAWSALTGTVVQTQVGALTITGLAVGGELIVTSHYQKTGTAGTLGSRIVLGTSVANAAYTSTASIVSLVRRDNINLATTTKQYQFLVVGNASTTVNSAGTATTGAGNADISGGSLSLSFQFTLANAADSVVVDWVCVDYELPPG